MPKAEEHLQNAERCERMARQCPVHERDAFQRLAGLFRELAEDARALRPPEPPAFGESD